MLKKILLPVSAVAAMSLMACSGSAKVQVQTEAAPAEENVSTVNAGDTGTYATGEMTDEQIAAATKNQMNGTGGNEGGEHPIPAKCEIISESATSLQMVITVPDSGSVSMDVALDGNTVRNATKLVFTPNVSEESIAKECENAKGDESAAVTCQDRTIDVLDTITDPAAAMMFPMVTGELKELCKNIQKTGFLDMEPENSSEATPSPSGAAIANVQCNMDMNSNVWTIKFENNTTITYEFNGNVTKISHDAIANMGTPEMCAMAANAAAQEGGKIRCEGSNAFVSEISEEEGLTKENVKNQFAPLCGQNP